MQLLILGGTVFLGSALAADEHHVADLPALHEGAGPFPVPVAGRREALARLHALIDAARVEPKLRRATKPTKASKERRLAGKVRYQRVKQLRGRVRGDD